MIQSLYSDRELKYLRGLVPLGLLLDQFSFGVDCEDPTHWNSDLLIGKHILCGDKVV